MNLPASQRGYALLTVLLMLALLSAIALSFFTLTRSEMQAVQSNRNSVRGYYAAEGGLNVRAEQLRNIFVNYALPSGSAPTVASACTPGNLGSGDYMCAFHSLDNRSVSTYVIDDPTSPRQIVVPLGEPFQGLNAAVYDYDLRSVASSTDGSIEAQLDLAIETRLIPLFQFMIFFNKDLEITPGPAMTLNGPVHSNFDLYAAANTTVDILGQVTASGDIYRGRKEADLCWTGPFRVINPVTATDLPACSGNRRLLTNSDLTAWNGNVVSRTDSVSVPTPDALDPAPGSAYWDRADIRIVYDQPTSTIQVRNADGTDDSARSTALGTCASATSLSNTFYNHREGAAIDMLDVDVQGLMDCIQSQNLLNAGRLLSDTTDGGLVVYLGVEGPLMTGVNNYGVRLTNGAELESSSALAPVPVGVTFVTNQAAYVQGDFNTIDKRPAAIMADSMNVLSNAWPAGDWPQATSMWLRDATPTTVNAAFLAGTDSTGGGEGSAFQDVGNYSGGVHNMPRHHEDWTGIAFNYLGSLVSLNVAQHVSGGLIVGWPQYAPPSRNYAFDTDFIDPANLPPLTPRFAYTKQTLYVRDFEY